MAAAHGTVSRHVCGNKPSKAGTTQGQKPLPWWWARCHQPANSRPHPGEKSKVSLSRWTAYALPGLCTLSPTLWVSSEDYLPGFCGWVSGFLKLSLKFYACLIWSHVYFLGWGATALIRSSQEDPDPHEWSSGPRSTQSFEGQSETLQGTASVPETLAPVSSLSSLSHGLKSLLSLQVLAELSALYMVASGNHTFLKKTSNNHT